MRSWRKRKGSKPAPAATAGQTAADKALDKETQKLRRAKVQTGGIIEAAETLKRLGQQNDFAAKIHRALGGGA